MLGFRGASRYYSERYRDGFSIQLIETAHENDTKVGICGQAPSDHLDFVAFLVEAQIDSMSLNLDSVLDVIERVGEIEREKMILGLCGVASRA